MLASSKAGKPKLKNAIYVARLLTPKSASCAISLLSKSGSFMRYNGAEVLATAFERYGFGECSDATVTKEACGALRSVTLADDRRKDFSGTFVIIGCSICFCAIGLL